MCSNVQWRCLGNTCKDLSTNLVSPPSSAMALRKRNGVLNKNYCICAALQKERRIPENIMMPLYKWVVCAFQKYSVYSWFVPFFGFLSATLRLQLGIFLIWDCIPWQSWWIDKNTTKTHSQFYVPFYALVNFWLLSSYNTFMQQVAIVLTKLFFSSASLDWQNFFKPNERLWHIETWEPCQKQNQYTRKWFHWEI